MWPNSQFGQGSIASPVHIVKRHGRGGHSQEKADDHVIPLLTKNKKTKTDNNQPYGDAHVHGGSG